MPENLPETEKWLTLAQAAKQLNVHPTTLRRWADNGDIPFMRTPGGHRRFTLAALKQFSEVNSRLRTVSALEQHWAQQALTQTRQVIVKNPEKSWLTSLDAESREKNRLLGQRLLGLILQHIASEEENDSIMSEAQMLGQEYGQLGLEMGLPLKAALEASMFFRDNLMETALELPETARVQPEASLRLMRRVNGMLNLVHLAIAEVYDSRGGVPAEKGSDVS